MSNTEARKELNETLKEVTKLLKKCEKLSEEHYLPFNFNGDEYIPTKPELTRAAALALIESGKEIDKDLKTEIEYALGDADNDKDWKNAWNSEYDTEPGWQSWQNSSC